jgi:CheY-like chemotaxis protein
MVKILFLIDDDQDDREIFKEAVASFDPKIEIIFASDGIEALEILSSTKIQPDLIFLDYNMPRMNGLECLKRLKSDFSLRNIPVVMYTTSGDREQEKVILKLGADHYMQKTVSFEGLCKELGRLIRLVGSKADLKSLRTR